MCAWIEPNADRRSCLVLKTKKHRLRKVQQRQIVSVCLGIEHMIKCRKITAAERKRVAASGGQGLDHRYQLHDERACRLCQSTRRVLSTARAHASHKHDGRNCEACRMWAMVKESCASMRILIAAGSGGKSSPAVTAGSSRSAVPLLGDGERPVKKVC